MALDPYQPCFCGSGKKAKFCCAADILQPLGDVIAAIDSDQRVAALDQLNRLLDKKPNNPALLALKGATQLELGEMQAAQQTVANFLAAAPDNPVALAQSAVLEGAEGSFVSAVAKLQRSIEQSGESFSFTVYQSIGALARLLLAAGHYLAGRAHLTLQTALEGGQEPRSLQALAQVNAAPSVPLIMKDERSLFPPAAESSLLAADVASWNEALADARHAHWLLALRKWEGLTEKHPAEADLLRNVATLRGWLADEEGAAKAWHQFASLASVPQADAVEAEALAQNLDGPQPIDLLDEVAVVFTIREPSQLQERLLSNKQVESVPFRPEEYREADEPPPMSVYLAFDRETPATADGITVDTAPQALGELALYGKQTDREARVEYTTTRTDEFAAKLQAVRGLLGEFVQGEPQEEVIGSVLRTTSALAVNWRLPAGTPAETQFRLVAEHRRRMLMDVFPNLPQGALGGKTAKEAAADPAQRPRVLGAILLVEQLGEEAGWDFDFNDLRRSLGLPTADPIDPTGVAIRTLPLVRLARVDAAKLKDEDLLEAFSRAVMFRAGAAAKKLGMVLAERPSALKEIDQVGVFTTLSRMARRPDEALAFNVRARDAAVAAGNSPAPLLLSELSLRLQMGDSTGATEVLQRIQSRHMSEPGVAQALYQLLVALGVVSPQGMPGMAAGPPGASPLGAGPAAPAAGGLWTPDAPAANPPEAGKSKLWIPGMD